MDILFTIMRAVVAYLLLLAVTRIAGRKTVSEMTFYDYTAAITMGTLTAYIALGESSTPLAAGVALVTFGALAVLMSFIVLKSLRMNRLLNSLPVVVIAKGEFVKSNMKKIKINVETLMSLLREKNAFNAADVEYAVMESDGKLSVLLKVDKQPLTPFDMHIATPYKGLMTDIIVDGRLISCNLARAGKDVAWLTEQLSKKSVRLEDVFYAGIDSSGGLYITLGLGENSKL